MPNLRTALLLDALASAGLGAVMIIAAPQLEDLLGLQASLALYGGLLLVAWACFVAWVASRPLPERVLLVVTLNIGYVVCSVAFALMSDRLNAWGVTLTLAQAVAVVGLTAMQAPGLREGDRRSAAIG